MSGYFLESVDGELVLVLRTHDEDLIYSVIRRLGRMRDKKVKDIGRTLEQQWWERQKD